VDKIDGSASIWKMNQQKKIRWIIKEVGKGERTICRIAKMMNFAPQMDTRTPPVISHLLAISLPKEIWKKPL